MILGLRSRTLTLVHHQKSHILLWFVFMDTRITLVRISIVQSSWFSALNYFYVCDAGNFDRLLPLSKKYNIRVIAFNRRDYEGSTPLSTQELEALNGDDADAHAEFLRERGLEIALFIGWAIKEKSLPPIKIEGASASGGIVLLGWSLGNITTLAFLANLDKYPVELNRVFKSYLRRFDMYGKPWNKRCRGEIVDLNIW